jgi:hypothetical protein
MRPPLDSFVTTAPSSTPASSTKPTLDSFVVAQPEPEDDMGYIRRVANAYSQSAKNIKESVQDTASKLKSGDGSAIKNTGSLLRTALRSAGAVANSAFAPITEAPGVKQVLEGTGKIIGNTPGVSDIIKYGMGVAEKNPTVARDVRDIFDIVTLGTGKAVEAPVGAEIRALGTDLQAGAKAILKPSEEAIQSKVISLFQKSIKPTAKKTAVQAERFDNDILSALRTIKANSDQLNIEDATGELVTGRVPQTINELAQGLEQTKSIVFKQYDDLAKQAGTQGVEIASKPIAEEVLKVAQNKALQLTNPEIIKYAEGWSQRLQAMGNLDTETTQEVIKLMNSNLQAFYKNPTYDTASKVAVDAGIANNFRQALDDAIEKATGANYQALKNQYSALKAIENDVVRATMREARKNAKGLLDYTDMLTSGQMVSGILSLNPAMFTKGAIERGFKEYIKRLNDPNRAIDNIFNTLKIDPSQGFNPVSATFKAVMPNSGVPASPVDIK